MHACSTWLNNHCTAVPAGILERSDPFSVVVNGGKPLQSHSVTFSSCTRCELATVCSFDGKRPPQLHSASESVFLNHPDPRSNIEVSPATGARNRTHTEPQIGCFRRVPTCQSTRGYSKACSISQLLEGRFAVHFLSAKHQILVIADTPLLLVTLPHYF